MGKTYRKEPKRRNLAWDAELLKKCHVHGWEKQEKARRKRAKQDLRKDPENYDNLT